MGKLGSIPRIFFLLAVLLVVLMPPYQGHASAPCSASQSPSWQICGPIQSFPGVNEQSTVIQASDGTLQLAWTQIDLFGSSSIYYSTRLADGTWAGNSSITNVACNARTPSCNRSPSLVQANNGTVFMFWSYKTGTASNFQLYYIHLKGSVWSAYAKVPLKTSTTLNDTQPSAAVGRDGTIWLAWTRDDSTPSGGTVHRWLMYETLNSTGWAQTGEQTITSSTDTNWNFEPSVIVSKDGVPKIAYSRGQASLANFQINYIYRIGSGWSTPRAIVTSNSTANDENPSLTQDRNGTLWVFWTRAFSSNYAISSEYTWDNGTSPATIWRGETLLTPVCVGCPDSEFPAAVQSSADKNLWVFYTTNPNGISFDIWGLVTVNPISPVHDIAMSNKIGSYGTNASEIYAGGFNNPYAGIRQSPVVILFVTVQNLGDFAENASVSLTVTNTTSYPLGTQTVLIPVGGSSLFSFLWNTSGVRPARYGLSAIGSIPGERVGNKGDESLVAGNVVHLLPLGDVNQDGSVTLSDVAVFFYNYGFSCYTPLTCSPRYNPFADLNGNGIIDIVDVGVVSKNFDIFT